MPRYCLPPASALQFEDFNIEHASPLLDRYRYSHVSRQQGARAASRDFRRRGRGATAFAAALEAASASHAVPVLSACAWRQR